MRELPEAYDRARRGDFGPVATSALPAEWEPVARTLSWLAHSSDAHPPEVHRDRLPSSGTQQVELQWLRARLLERDVERLEALIPTLSAPVICELASGWSACFQGRPSGVGQELFGRTKEHNLSELFAEAAVLRGVEAMLSGSDEALPLLRRAVRIARTEGYWAPHFHGSLWLGRHRRQTGRVHHAALILSDLRAHAPARWWAAIDHELFFAGVPLEAPPPNPADPLLAYLSSLPTLEVAGLAELTRALASEATSAARPAFLRADLRALVGALDPDAVHWAEDPLLVAWRAGERSDCPAGLEGLVMRMDAAGCVYPPVVIIPQDGRVRRALDLGLDGVELTRLPLSGSKRPTRVETLVAAMALEPGLSRERLFERCHGFGFRPELHDGAFRRLRNRARRHVEGWASIVESGDGLRLEPRQPLVVADPRCDASVEEQLLRLLGESGTRSAKDIAQMLGIPLRTAQAALQGLVEEGSAVADRKGNAVEYRIEDTAFTVPTQWGVAHQLR